jgi:tellurite resistance protein
MSEQVKPINAKCENAAPSNGGAGRVIRYFPISFFAIILGLSGFSIASQKVQQLLNINVPISQYLVYLSVLIFALISVMYILKIILAHEEFMSDWRHPIRMNFMAAFSISLLLFSVAFLDINTTAAKIFWITGAVIHLLITLRILTFWIQHNKLEMTHLNPVWFIPVVGNIIVPLAGVALFSAEISWFFFSIGMIFWIVLFSILFNRILFHKPFPEKLLPTFFILLAPPAIGFVAYVKLSGALNDFARTLYYFALFIFILLVVQLKYIYKAKFFLSWWAYSFPIAAITIATVLMYKQSEQVFFKDLAYFMYVLLVGVIIALLVRTVKAMSKKQVCVKEE